MRSPERPLQIKDEKDIKQITHLSERHFARFLLKHNPNLVVIYEPQIFTYTAHDGKKYQTTPDFLIRNPQNSDTPVYVEITVSRKRNGDRKERQKMVMKNAAPEVRYVVLYNEQLSKIRQRHPDFNPWSKKEPKL